jgi:hypothetical protein
MMKYLILFLTLVSLTAKADDINPVQGLVVVPPKKYDGQTQTTTLSTNPAYTPTPPHPYKSMGWGGTGTLSPRGVVDEWEEFKPMQ